MSRGYAAKGIRERIHTVRLDEAYRLIRRRHRDRPLGTIPTSSRFSDPQSHRQARGTRRDRACTTPEVRRCTDRLRNQAAQHRKSSVHRQKPGRLVTDPARSGQEGLSTAQAIGPSGSLSTAQVTGPSGRLVTDQAGLEPERLVTDQAPVSGQLDDAAMTSPIIPSRPFDHPVAWTVADIGGKDAFAFDLDDDCTRNDGIIRQQLTIMAI